MYPHHWDKATIDVYNTLKSELDRHQAKVRNERAAERVAQNMDWEKWEKAVQNGDTKAISQTIEEASRKTSGFDVVTDFAQRGTFNGA